MPCVHGSDKLVVTAEESPGMEEKEEKLLDEEKYLNRELKMENVEGPFDAVKLMNNRKQQDQVKLQLIKGAL